MALENPKDFSQRLLELNHWQNEQQMKLRLFKESQKKLVNADYNTALNQLNMLKDNQEKNIVEYCISKGVKDSCAQKNCSRVQLKLNDFVDESSCNISQENETNLQKKFLRRGDGLARFRMTIDDFKNPPKIYTERKIKTYVDKKFDNAHKYSLFSSKNTKTVKNEGVKFKKPLCSTTSKRNTPIPVNIYVTERRPVESMKSAKTKQDHAKSQIAHGQKRQQNTETRGRKYDGITRCKKWNFEGSGPAEENRKNKCDESAFDFARKMCADRESEKKTGDDQELKLFEMLEEKVNESSFCSTSSLVDRLWNQSAAATSLAILSSPNKCKASPRTDLIPADAKGVPSHENSIGKHNVVVKVSEEKVDAKTEFDEPRTLVVVVDDTATAAAIKNSKLEIGKINDPTSNGEQEKCGITEKTVESVKDDFPTREDLNNLNEKSLKLLSGQFVNNSSRQQKKIYQNEIAVTLQRKGLQDNVKQLMNWEHSTRKKIFKRPVKKMKVKPRKIEDRKDKSNSSKEQSDKVTFTTTLLRDRLEELEKEIVLFRKENSRVQKLEKDLNEERIKLGKERKEYEKQMQEEREKLEAKLLEGKKKLKKERTVFETYCREVSDRPNRKEREEILLLKKENEKLKEMMAAKEARWGASQARLRNQIRNLEKENSQLKAEKEKLEKSTLKKAEMGNERTMNSKIIRAINFELEKLRTTTMTSGDLRVCTCGGRLPGEKLTGKEKKAETGDGIDVDTSLELEGSNKLRASMSADSGIEAITSRRDSSTVKVDYSRHDKPSRCGGHDQSDGTGTDEAEVRNLVTDKNGSTDSTDSENDEVNGSNECLPTLHRLGGEARTRAFNGNNDFFGERQTGTVVGNGVAGFGLNGTNPLDGSEMTVEFENLRNKQHKLRKKDSKGHVGVSEAFNAFKETDRNDEDRVLPSVCCPLRLTETNLDGRILPDGTKEITYPNGNVKKILPDNKIVKILYYNGDIKETNIESGSEKYYYSETDTWHTRYKDGIEVTEFPSGQTERRYANGSSEILFPNGCVRYSDSSGTVEWKFTDGTVIKTNEFGHKILLLTNGQKETHTKEFKKREYPDGTVKIIYPNGTQETRYASGRVRLKDKDGHLILDSGSLGAS